MDCEDQEQICACIILLLCGKKCKLVETSAELQSSGWYTNMLVETSAELQSSGWYTNMLVETSAELQCSGWYTNMLVETSAR